MKDAVFYVYIMTNKRNTVLYIGVTSNLVNRVAQHKGRVIDGFTKKYYLTELVYFEVYTAVDEAIAREKQMKKFSRHRKNDLVTKRNPTWQDLSSDF